MEAHPHDHQHVVLTGMPWARARDEAELALGSWEQVDRITSGHLARTTCHYSPCRATKLCRAKMVA